MVATPIVGASAVAKSMVAASSAFETGRGVAARALGAADPQDAQKRTPAANWVPHEEQKAMEISRYSLPQKNAASLSS
jgi:hypothetical protein